MSANIHIKQTQTLYLCTKVSVCVCVCWYVCDSEQHQLNCRLVYDVVMTTSIIFMDKFSLSYSFLFSWFHLLFIQRAITLIYMCIKLYKDDVFFTYVFLFRRQFLIVCCFNRYRTFACFLRLLFLKIVGSSVFKSAELGKRCFTLINAIKIAKFMSRKRKCWFDLITILLD